MASTWSALKIELLETGANAGSWGTLTNANLGDAVLGEAITGQATVDFASDADVTITLTDTATTQAARNLRLNITESSTGVGSVRNLILGSGCQIEKFYLINNTGTGAKTIKNTSGTGISVPAGKATLVYNNGTNVVDAASYFTSLTLGSALPVASGGTGLTAGTSGGIPAYTATGTLTSSGALTQYGVVIGGGAGAVPTSTAVGTATHVLTSNGAGVAPTFQALPAGGVTTFTAGTTGFTPSTATSGAVTLAGTLNVANGGTGQTTFTSGRLLYGNGTGGLNTSANLTFNGTSLNLDSAGSFTSGSSGYGLVLSKNGVGGKNAIISVADASSVLLINNSAAGWDSVATYAAGSENMRLNAQALGVGIVPQTGWSGFKALQIGANTSLWSSTTGGGASYYSNNLYYNGSNRIYITSGSASEYQQASSNGSHQWYIAPSGTAGNAISLTQAMTLEGTDRTNLLVGTTSSTFSAATRGVIEIAGSSTALVSLKAGSALAYIYNDGSTLNIQNNSVGVFQLSTNSALRFQIGSAGQWGIGGATYGTAGQVFTSGGSGAAPTWSTIGGSSWVYLTTVTASNSATVDVENAFDSTYSTYVIVVSDMYFSSVSNPEALVRLKIGGSYQTGSNYAYATTDLYAGGANTFSGYGTTGGSSISIGRYLAGATASQTFSLTMTIPNPSGTSARKMIYGQGGFYASSDAYTASNFAGVWQSATSALTGIRFFGSAGNITAGTFRLYGIKAS